MFPLSTALPTCLSLSVTFAHFQQWSLPGASALFEKKHDCIIVPLPEPPPASPQLNKQPGIHCAIKQKQYCTFLCTVCTVSSWGFFRRWGGSEIKKADEVLRWEGHGATFWVVGCAGMVCFLQKQKQAHNNQYSFFCLVLSLKCSFTCCYILVSYPLWSSAKCKREREKKKNTLPSKKGCGSVCRSAGYRCIALCEDSSGSA